MAIMNYEMPKAQRPNGQGSKYDVIFAELEAGTTQCHVETEVVNSKKVHGRMNSAIAAYRQRTGDNSAFAVRVFELDGKEVVGVWKLNKPFKPKTK